MATDGLSLYATISELQSLIDARIDKVQQPDKDVVLLHLHGSRCGRVRLMINIHNENGRIQLTSQQFENPDIAPVFCMLLRKHLIGCRIASLEQRGMDRIAVFSLFGKNELQDEVHLQLIVELMGKHGNLFLLHSDGTILDCMRHFGPGEDATRICLPNCTYVDPPKQEKLHPFAVSETALCDLALGRPPRLWLGSEFWGISKLCSQQIVSDETPPARIGSQCYAVFQDLKKGVFYPSVLPGRGVLPFVPQNAAFLSYPTMCEAQEAFYRMRDQAAVLTRKRTTLRSAIEHAYKRVCKKAELCMMQIGSEESMEQDRKYGELLVSNLGTLKSTSDAAIVWDYYVDPPVEVRIPLDPRFSVQQNAQRYFKRYRKAKTAKAFAQSQIVDLSAEREYLEGLLLSVEDCESGEELSELREELIAQGYVKADTDVRRKGTKSQASLSEPYRYTAPDGTVIRVGKNNRQNEMLLKTEAPDYIWMHAKNVAASHVYIESADPSKETLLLAAEIAAMHSKASASAQVPVDYTLHRHVKKPSGSRPGFVNYFHQHTLYVTPYADKLLPLRLN